MRIKLTIHRPDMGKAPGDVIDLKLVRAKQLIEAGQAEAIPDMAEAVPAQEMATLPVPETAAGEPSVPTRPLSGYSAKAGATSGRRK